MKKIGKQQSGDSDDAYCRRAEDQLAIEGLLISFQKSLKEKIVAFFGTGKSFCVHVFLHLVQIQRKAPVLYHRICIFRAFRIQIVFEKTGIGCLTVQKIVAVEKKTCLKKSMLTSKKYIQLP